MIFRKFLNLYRERQARKRLQQLVDQTANSNVIKQYRKYRTAAKKGVALKREKSLG